MDQRRATRGSLCTNWRAVDADVGEGLDRTNGNQGLDNPRAAVLYIYRVDMGQWDTAHGDRDCMQPGVAGFKMRRTIALFVMWRRSLMLVSGEPVLMLRVIV